jgi:hypothetical protein
MTKQHFIALANLIRENPSAFSPEAVEKLADFCQAVGWTTSPALAEATAER